MTGALLRRLHRTPPGYRYSIGRIVLAYSGLMVIVLMGTLDETIVATALPHVVSDLGGFSSYSWAFGAYLLFQTVTIPVYGKLGDAYGRRRLLLIAIVIFLVGSALCGLAQTMTELIVFRSIQGIGAGGLIPLVQATIGDLVPPRDRGRYQGLVSAAFATGAILGPTAGGLVVDNASWRWIFYANLPIGAVAFVVAATVPSLAPRRRGPIDLAGAALLAAGTGTLLVGLLSAGGSHAWLSAHVLGALAASALLLAVFALHERRVAEPILPFATLRMPTVAASSACVFILATCMYGTIVFVPLFAQGVIGASGTASGIVLTPFMLGIVVSSVAAGQWVSRTGRYRVFVLVGPAVMGAAMALLWRMEVDTTATEVARNMFVAGVGLGLINPVLFIVTQNAVPQATMGATVAFIQFARSIGATFGATAFGLVIAHGVQDGASGGLALHERDLAPGGRAELASAIRPGFLLALGLCALAFVIVLLGVKQRPLRRTFDEPATVSASVGG